MKACPQAAADFEQATTLGPQWAEAHNQAVGIYSDCPDPTFRHSEKTIVFIEHAIALEKNSRYLTVLALGILPIWPARKAVAAQTQAVESPRSLPAIVMKPPGNSMNSRPAAQN
jgi:hypothetical protein